MISNLETGKKIKIKTYAYGVITDLNKNVLEHIAQHLLQILVTNMRC